MLTQTRVSADSAIDIHDQTYTISPAWDIDKNDVQQLVHLSEEKSSLFRYGYHTHISNAILLWDSRMLHVIRCFIDEQAT